MNANGNETLETPAASVDVAADSEFPVNLADLLDDEPSVVSGWQDSLIVTSFKESDLRTDAATDALAAEIWLRHWLYAGECSSTIEDAITLAQSNKQTGFSDQFSTEFKRLLKPLRKKDDGNALPDAEKLDDREKRIWGLLVTRMRVFLEADGLMALIPGGTHGDEDGVAVPYRFFPSEQGVCQDTNGNELTASDWSDVLEELGDLGPLADSQVLRVGAVFPSRTPPGGASIGLSVALAWARRQARDRDLPLFSPLDIIATGKMTGNQISAVDGTGGQTETDTQGGAKGQLARRLGVSLYVVVDATTSFNAGTGMKVCSLNSSTQWKDAHGQIVQAIKEIKLADSPRHLRRVEFEDPDLISSGKASEAQLWACWRRLGRLHDSYFRSAQAVDFDKIETWRRNAALKLGYKSIVPGFYDFSIVEDRHGDGKLRGRRLELDRLNDFLAEKGGMLPVTGPVGHGKSALLIAWRRSVQARPTHSVFYHYFDQNDDRLRSRSIFYRRLLEHLLIEVEGRPTDRETTEQDVLEAWDLWRQKENRRPLILAIDGLDEAEQCPPPFPDKFPENVWLVVSCRSRQDSALHQAIDSWKKRAGVACRKPLEVGPLDIPNLCSWLATLAEDWTPTSPVVQNLAAKVFDRTDGMALFIHHLWEDLREAIAKGQDLDAVLEETPVGFVKYLQTQWQRLNDDALGDGKCLLALKIVGYLIAAKGPLTDRELVSLLDLEPGMSLTNLPREAQRWMAVRPVATSDAWGARFSLNHWLIREAIGSRLRPEVYGHTLVEKCKSQWRAGSPYALRNLADHLIEKGLWRELDKLVTGADSDEFQRLQAQTFPDEPALLLASVRRALEEEAAKSQPEIAILAELSLTQATLIYRLAKPLTQGAADSVTPLELAEQMTRLPVQWDPAADFMWHLVAAWQLHKDQRNSDRNDHLSILAAARDVRLPAAWGFLAGTLLSETLSPSNSLLFSLVERLLSPEATAKTVGLLACRGRAGARVARQWLQRCSEKHRGNTETAHFESALRRSVVFGLAESGLWREAEWEARAAATIREQAVLLLNLAELAEDDLNRTDNLREWIDYLEPYVEYAQLSTAEYLRINSILGRICAIRARHRLLRGRSDPQELVRQAEAFVRGRMFVRGAGQFDVQVALALAYGKAASTCKSESERDKLCASARRHRCNAFRAWMNLRQDTKAATIEVFQIWLWFADLTFRLVGFGVLPTKVGRFWESRLRRTLLPTSSEEAARIFKLLNAGTDNARNPESPNETLRPESRYLEPVEWDHSIVVAIEAIVAAAGFTDAEVLQVIGRCISTTDRARGLARWIQARSQTGRNTDAESALRHALTLRDLDREDLAAAHSLLTGRLLSRGDQPAAAHHAVLAIQYGTDTLRGPRSIHLVELLTALSCAAGNQGADLFAQAVQLVEARQDASDEEKTFSFLHLAEIAHLREGVHASRPWFDEVLKLQFFGGRRYGDRNKKVTVLCEYARRVHSLRIDEQDKARALSRALGAARDERSLLRRCELLCEVAEAFAHCDEHQSANEVFADIQTELPVAIPKGAFPQGFLWRKQGVKPHLLRGHCLAKLVLGLGKVAIQQSDPHRPQPHHEARPLTLPWSEWTEARSLTPRQRTAVRYVFDEFFQGRLATALKLAAQVPVNRDGSAGLRTAACREIIDILPWLEWMESPSFTPNQRNNVFNIFDCLCAGNPVGALEHTIRLSGEENTGTGLRMAVCREIASYLNWGDWALTYASDQDLQKHDEALRGLALSSAAQGIWDADAGAWSFIRRIIDPSVSANTIRDLAEFSAGIGKVDEVLKRAKNLMSSREKDRVLHRIGGALVARFRQTTTEAEKTAVKQAIFELVPPCAEFFGAAYLMLARLIEIEPSKWRSVADVLSARGIIQPSQKNALPAPF